MKKFLSGLLIGTLLGLLSLPVVVDIAHAADHYIHSQLTGKIWEHTLAPTAGLFPFLIKGCTKDVRKNGHGWVFVNREYFECNKFEVFLSDVLFGEITTANRPDLRGQVNHNYRY